MEDDIVDDMVLIHHFSFHKSGNRIPFTKRKGNEKCRSVCI